MDDKQGRGTLSNAETSKYWEAMLHNRWGIDKKVEANGGNRNRTIGGTSTRDTGTLPNVALRK